MINFFLFNSGCGLGGMLQRISRIYKAEHWVVVTGNDIVQFEDRYGRFGIQG